LGGEVTTVSMKQRILNSQEQTKMFNL